jgi:hypothetical protein
MFAVRLLLVPDDGNILQAFTLAPAISWAVLVGAGYGLVRLIIDVGRLIERNRGGPPPPGGWTPPPPPP